MRLKTIYYTLMSIFLFAIILIYGKGFILPLIISLIVWFLIHQMRNGLHKIPLIKKLPTWATTILSSILLVFLIGFFSSLLISNIEVLAKSSRQYQGNINKLLFSLNNSLNINIESFIEEEIKALNFSKIFSIIFNSLTGLIGETFLVLLYIIFLFVEETFFSKKLHSIFTKKNEYDRFHKTLIRIENTTKKYLGYKTLIAFSTGTISYFILLIIGIDSPLFWAFLIFFMNYIPTVGALIATGFSAMYCLLQFGGFYEGILVVVFIGSLQVIAGNIVEPKLMGNTMNVSPMAAIIAFALWGAVWGIIGMILSIPITIILIILLSQFNETKSIAKLLSEKGVIVEN